MANTNDFVSDGKIGVDLSAVWASTSAGSTGLMPFGVGQTVVTNHNGIYRWARCASDTAAFDVVVFGTYADSAAASPTRAFVPITTTNAITGGVNFGNEVGFCQNSVASSYYTWVCMNGEPKINVLIACNPKVPLYTTATAGKLDDTLTSGYVIGVTINSSAVSASSMQGVAQWPRVINPAALP